MCAGKNFMYVWSENDILLCATHVPLSDMPNRLSVTLCIIYVNNYNIDIISPLCPCSTVKIYILVPVFSPLAVQNLLNIQSLRFITVSGIRTCTYSGIYT